MLAISAHIDEGVEAKTKECGFEGTLDAPLKTCHIKEQILPMLQAREAKMQQRIEFLEKIDDIDAIARIGF